MSYQYFKIAHLLFIISWMATVFYLPRILVHYAEGIKNNEDCRRLLIMARKLFYFGLTVFLFVLITGLILWFQLPIEGWWLYGKLFFVFVLFCYQLQTYRFAVIIKQGVPARQPRFYRIYNEIPILILVFILILVVIKPF